MPTTSPTLASGASMPPIIFTHGLSRVRRPQGVATIERIMEEIAHRLGLDALTVRRRNCYADRGRGSLRNVTPTVKWWRTTACPLLIV